MPETISRSSEDLLGDLCDLTELFPMTWRDSSGPKAPRYLSVSLFPLRYTDIYMDALTLDGYVT